MGKQPVFELFPDGTGYRVKTRFSKFYNLPELMSIFKEVADIQTTDILNLPLAMRSLKRSLLKNKKEILKSLFERKDEFR